MAKTLSDTVLDSLLDTIADNVDEIYVTSAQSSTYAQASVTYMLAAATGLTVGDGNGQYTIANGDVDGRKLTVTAIDDITITNSGTATHIALCGNAGSVLYGNNTLTASTALTATNEVDLASWKLTVRDPT